MISLKKLLMEGKKETLAVEFLKNLIAETEFENKVYIAGGAVRDELMGKPIKDIDLVVDMPDGGLKFAKWATKKMGNFKETANPVVFPTYGTAKFNLRGITYKGEDLSDIDIETVAPRSEEYTPGSRKPTVKGASLKADAERRDLTANSLFKNISTGEIIDLTGHGKHDLEKGVARTPLDPDQTFSDDPLRMLRLIRFFVKYDWDVPMNQLRALKRNASQIKNISSERVQEEFNKIFKVNNTGKAFKLIRNSGLGKEIFPEVIITNDKLKAMQSKVNYNVKLAILLNDLPQNVIDSILRRLKYPSNVIKEILTITKLKDFFNDGESTKQIRKFRRLAGNFIEPALELIDILKPNLNVDSIRSELFNMRNDPASPPVGGNDLIKLGLKPGPQFKEILDKIQDLFDENPSRPSEDYINLVKNI